VEVYCGSRQPDLQTKNSPEAIGKRRHPWANHSGIGDYNNIGCEFGSLIPQEILEMRTPRFFFTFDQENDIYREITFGLQNLLHAHYMGEDLAFVIG
jgi:hypothetical protein